MGKSLFALILIASCSIVSAARADFEDESYSDSAVSCNGAWRCKFSYIRSVPIDGVGFRHDEIFCPPAVGTSRAEAIKKAAESAQKSSDPSCVEAVVDRKPVCDRL